MKYQMDKVMSIRWLGNNTHHWANVKRGDPTIRNCTTDSDSAFRKNEGCERDSMR